VIVLDYITWSGFGSYRGEQRLNLADQGLVLVTGRNLDSEAADNNGCGKSTVFKAICWCANGQSVDGDKTVEVINRDSKAALTELGFTETESGAQYVIKRKRTKSGGELHFTKDGDNLTASTMPETQARIDAVIGMDFDTFRNTVLYGQGDVKRFADALTTDAERKAILKKVLRLDTLDQLKAAAQAAFSDIGKDISKHETAAGKLEAALGIIEGNITTLTRQAKEWDKGQAGRINDALEALDSCEHALKELQADAPDTTDLKTLLKQSRDQRAGVGKLRKEQGKRQTAKKALVNKRDEIEKLRQDAEEQRVTKGAHLDAGQSSLRAAKANLEALQNDGVCDHCHSRLDPETNPGYAEHIQESKKAILERDQKLQELAQEKADWAAKVASFDNDLIEVQEAIEIEQDAIDALAESIEALESLDDDIASLEGLIAEAEAHDSKIESAKADLASAQRDAERISDEENPHRAGLTEQKRAAKVHRVKISNKADEIEALKTKAAHYKFWTVAYSDRGLISFVLDELVPVVNERANEYLAVLSDGDIQIKIDTETELKSGDKRDKLSIIPMIEGHEGVTPSGAQRKKMSIAIDLGLMDLIAERESCAINMVMLDEVLDGLDSVGKERVMVLLRNLSAKRSSIFVVSQDREVADQFDRVVMIEKRGGKSEIVEGV